MGDGCQDLRALAKSFAHALLHLHRRRALVGLSLMTAQAFFYNAIFFTYALIHADMTHLGFNALWLLAFGSPVARRFGAPLAVISQDVFPEIAVELGRIRSPAVVGALRAAIGAGRSAVIAEVKRERANSPSPVIAVLAERRIRSGSISKYCLGLISTHAGLRKNNFAEQIRHFQRVLNNAA